MIRTCAEDDWSYMKAEHRPAGAPCGRMYDDVDHSTICPHDELPPQGGVVR